MYLSRKKLIWLCGVLFAVIVLLALAGCGALRDLPRYW